MSNTTKPDNPYKYLAQSIITQAIKDYQIAIDKKNGKLRTEVEQFVKSKWFDQVARHSRVWILRLFSAWQEKIFVTH